jgi:DNA-binding NarL/FixJ family response regulator
MVEKSPLKILIVEDNPHVAASLSSLLGDEVNHLVLGIARNVSSAIVLIRQTGPQVVILDIHLEHELNSLNGIDLLKTLQQDYPQIVVIMLSNYSEPQYRQKCERLGARYFFDKTNDFDKIPETLNQIYAYI